MPDLPHNVWVFLRSGWRDACLVPMAQHRALLEAFGKRVGTGVSPKRAWHDALREARLVPSAVLVVMLEIDRRRLARGMAEDLISENARVAQRGYAKWRRPWATQNTRVPSEKTQACLAHAAMTDVTGEDRFSDQQANASLGRLERMLHKRVNGALVPPAALTREEYACKLLNLDARHERDRPTGNREHVGQHMREISPLGVAARSIKVPAHERSRIAGLGAKALAAKMTAEQRSARARAAALARWGRVSQSGAAMICG